MVCGQYKDKEGKNYQKLTLKPKISIFKILKYALESYIISSVEPTIPKNMIPQQKMWAGCYCKRDQNLAPSSP